MYIIHKHEELRSFLTNHIENGVHKINVCDRYIYKQSVGSLTPSVAMFLHVPSPPLLVALGQLVPHNFQLPEAPVWQRCSTQLHNSTNTVTSSRYHACALPQNITIKSHSILNHPVWEKNPMSPSQIPLEKKSQVLLYQAYEEMSNIRSVSLIVFKLQHLEFFINFTNFADSVFGSHFQHY